jgi:hypothetical protein
MFLVEKPLSCNVFLAYKANKHKNRQDGFAKCFVGALPNRFGVLSGDGKQIFRRCPVTAQPLTTKNAKKAQRSQRRAKSQQSLRTL